MEKSHSKHDLQKYFLRKIQQSPKSNIILLANTTFSAIVIILSHISMVPWSLRSSFPCIISFADPNKPQTAFAAFSPFFPLPSSGYYVLLALKLLLCSLSSYSSHFLLRLPYPNPMWHLRPNSKYCFPWKASPGDPSGEILPSFVHYDNQCPCMSLNNSHVLCLIRSVLLL